MVAMVQSEDSVREMVDRYTDGYFKHEQENRLQVSYTVYLSIAACDTMQSHTVKMKELHVDIKGL